MFFDGFRTAQPPTRKATSRANLPSAKIMPALSEMALVIQPCSCSYAQVDLSCVFFHALSNRLSLCSMIWRYLLALSEKEEL